MDREQRAAKRADKQNKDNKQWYMISTVSQKEEKVIESLKNRVEAEGMLDAGWFDKEEGFLVMMAPYLSPKELEKRDRGDAYNVKKRNLFPGYIFINMEMTNDAWFLVRNTQYVTGLIGSSGNRSKPTPVSKRDIRKMQRKVAEAEREFNEGIFADFYNIEANDNVVINDDKLTNLEGWVTSVDRESTTATVAVILFGKKTEVETHLKNLTKKEDIED